MNGKTVDRENTDAYKLEKNPLAQAFGLTLKTLRAEKSSAYISSILAVSNSFVRLLEVGATNINSGKILKLIDAFPQIEFQPLTKLLTAISITDSFKESIGTYKGALTDIGETENEFKDLFETLKVILSNRNLSQDRIYQLLEENKFHLKLIQFLTRKPALDFVPSDDDDDYDRAFINLLNETPSVYVDTIASSLKNLKNINPNLFAQDSSEWEKENNYNFIKLIGIFKSIEEILTPENIEKFNQKYLLNEDFKELNYIILESNKSVKEYETAFKNALSQRWGNHKRKNSNQADNSRYSNALAKISFKYMNPNQPAVVDLLNSKFDVNQKQAIWIFVTKAGNKIGFSLSKKGDSNDFVYGQTLSYYESKRKFQQFVKLWHDTK